MSHKWRSEAKIKGQSLWIGRSRFPRPQTADVFQSISSGGPSPGDVPVRVGMEDAACRAARSPDQSPSEDSSKLYSPRVTVPELRSLYIEVRALGSTRTTCSRKCRRSTWNGLSTSGAQRGSAVPTWPVWPDGRTVRKAWVQALKAMAQSTQRTPPTISP